MAFNRYEDGKCIVPMCTVLSEKWPWKGCDPQMSHLSSAQGLRDGRINPPRRAKVVLPTHHLVPFEGPAARRRRSHCAKMTLVILEWIWLAFMRLVQGLCFDYAGRRVQQACRVAAPRDTSLQSEAERFVEALENTDVESGTDASQTELVRLQGKLRECQEQVHSPIASPVTR